MPRTSQILRRLCIAAIILTCGLSSAEAQLSTLGFQGLVTDPGRSQVADADYNFQFRIYNQLSGGSPIWGPEPQTLAVKDGVFNALLGSVTPIDLPFDEQYYLGIVVAGDTIAPRTPLTPAPYSFFAENVAHPLTISASSGPPLLSITNTSPGSPIAAYFGGVVRVTDTLRVYGDGRIDGNLAVIGTLSKGGGSFKIDHPLDPYNKYLFHSFVESPEMMNIYNGTVILDDRGRADVSLPEWFEALNRDYRYQLTAIGRPGPNLHVSSKIRNNRFSIGGGEPGMEVSWTVTGVRHDPYAAKNRIQVEAEKPAAERGTLLHPDAYGVLSSQ